MQRRLSPMKFIPLLKALPWGGRNLLKLLDKSLPEGSPYGESWEVVDLPNDQSVVEGGELDGLSLAELVQDHKDDLLGSVTLLMGRFPTLFKFIDAQDTLSVQVHPDEQACAELGNGARPKTEAWYILRAEPGAKLYIGMKPGIGSEQLQQALETGEVEKLLNAIEVKAGEFYFVPAGALHAIGAGIVLAEIQQSSDTTYRVFDWNRVGLDGKPRQLHVKQALSSIRPHLRGRIESDPPFSNRPGVRCEFFSFELIDSPCAEPIQLERGRPQIVACIQGSCRLHRGSAQALALSLGQTCLMPASCAGHVILDNESKNLLIRL